MTSRCGGSPLICTDRTSHLHMPLTAGAADWLYGTIGLDQLNDDDVCASAMDAIIRPWGDVVDGPMGAGVFAAPPTHYLEDGKFYPSTDYSSGWGHPVIQLTDGRASYRYETFMMSIGGDIQERHFRQATLSAVAYVLSAVCDAAQTYRYGRPVIAVRVPLSIWEGGARIRCASLPPEATDLRPAQRNPENLLTLMPRDVYA